jgi:hypothetical protein
LGLAVLVGSVATIISLASRPAASQSLAPPTPLGVDSATGPELLWFEKSGEFIPRARILHATDWNGIPTATLRVPCRPGCLRLVSPAGQRLLVSQTPLNGASLRIQIVLDVVGRQVASFQGSDRLSWADDSRHLCGFRGAGSGSPAGSGTAELSVVDPETPALSRVIPLAPPADVGNNPLDPGHWALLACSPGEDRVVLSFDEPKPVAVHDVRVLRISAPQQVGDLNAGQLEGIACGCPITALSVNHDAKVAVATTSDGSVELIDLGTGKTQPWPGNASVPGSVLGVSWNGHRLLAEGGVLDIGTGRVVWRPQAFADLVVLAARPGADDLLIMVSAAGGTGHPLEWIIRSNGVEIRVPAGYQ